MTKYSLEKRLEAVQAYLEGIRSYKDVAREHGVDPTMLKTQNSTKIP